MLGEFLNEGAVEEASEKRTKKKINPVTQLNADTAQRREERLAKTGSNTRDNAPPPPPPPPKPPPPVDKSAMIDKLNAYRERFPEVKSRNKITVKSSVEEIEDELHFIESQLGSSGYGSSMAFLVLAMGAAEQSTKFYNPLGLKLDGLSKVTQDNSEQLAPIMDELVIKYGLQMSMGPEARLAFTLATMVYTVHAANTGNVAVAQAMAKMSAPTTDL